MKELIDLAGLDVYEIQIPLEYLDAVQKWLDSKPRIYKAAAVPVIDACAHWEPFGEYQRKCSACGNVTHVETCMGKPIYDYCPRCGARMCGGDNDGK